MDMYASLLNKLAKKSELKSDGRGKHFGSV